MSTKFDNAEHFQVVSTLLEIVWNHLTKIPSTSGRNTKPSIQTSVSILAKCYLTISASSVPVEAMFLMSGLILDI